MNKNCNSIGFSYLNLLKNKQRIDHRNKSQESSDKIQIDAVKAFEPLWSKGPCNLINQLEDVGHGVVGSNILKREGVRSQLPFEFLIVELGLDLNRDGN